MWGVVASDNTDSNDVTSAQAAMPEGGFNLTSYPCNAPRLKHVYISDLHPPVLSESVSVKGVLVRMLISSMSCCR